MSESELLDSGAIQRLQRLGGNAFVVKMIDLFASYGEEKLAAAQSSHQAGDLVGIANAVHPIKSSAGNIGAKRVQTLAQQIEELARQSKADDLASLLTELNEVFSASKKELEQVKETLGKAPTETK